jgi:hypothetical protein
MSCAERYNIFRDLAAFKLKRKGRLRRKCFQLSTQPHRNAGYAGLRHSEALTTMDSEPLSPVQVWKNKDTKRFRRETIRNLV